MEQTNREVFLLVSWRRVRKTYSPDRVRLVSTPVLRVNVPPEYVKGYVPLWRNLFTFIGTDKPDILKVSRNLTRTHFNISQVPMEGVRGLFWKISCLIERQQDGCIQVTVTYHHPDFKNGVSRSVSKHLQLPAGRLINPFADHGKLVTFPDNFFFLKPFVDELLGSNTETILTLFNPAAEKQGEADGIVRNEEGHLLRLRLYQDGQQSSMSQAEVEHLHDVLTSKKDHVEPNDWKGGLTLTNLYDPPDSVLDSIAKTVLTEYQTALQVGGYWEFEIPNIEERYLKEIEMLGQHMSKKYGTDPKLPVILYALSGNRDSHLYIQKAICEALPLSWYVHGSIFGRHSISRTDPFEKICPVREVASPMFAVLAALQPLLSSQEFTLGRQNSDKPGDFFLTNKVLEQLRTKHHLWMFVTKIINGVELNSIWHHPRVKLDPEAKMLLERDTFGGSSPNVHLSQILEWKLFQSKLRANHWLVDFADCEEVFRPMDCLTMSTHKCERPPNATLVKGGLCLGGGIFAQLYTLPKPSGGLTYHIRCETISQVVLGDFPIDHSLQDLGTITPTVSIEFFPEQSWYCVSLSSCNLSLNISVHKLDVTAKTLTQLSVSSFDRTSLDPMGLFVTHQVSSSGICQRRTDKPEDPLASFWMTNTHLFCLTCPLPGFIRLLGCKKTDLKFQILSYPGYSRRTGAYRLKMNQELLCSSNEGGKPSFITVRPIEEHANLRGVYEIRHLTLKF